MWDPSTSEDQTPWSAARQSAQDDSSPTPEDVVAASSPSEPSPSEPSVSEPSIPEAHPVDAAPVTPPVVGPSVAAPAPQPSINPGQPVGAPSAPVPPVAAPPVTAPTVTGPPPVTPPVTVAAEPQSPGPFGAIGSSPAVAPNSPPPTFAAPSFGSSLGAPPAPVAPNSPGLSSGPVATVVSNEPSSGKPRRWPLLVLALATIAVSGLLSWLVASSVNNNSAQISSTETPAPVTVQADEQEASTAEDAEAIPSIAAPALEGASGEVFDGEPFARAAEIIRPSVVQLNLGQGLGTGVIIDANGTILTAAHVLGDADEVQVTFFDGSSAQGEVVGSDTPTDVAVVRVDPTGRNLVPAQLADGNDVQVGQLAVAVGSPFGFDQTVTAGIISAVDRIVNGVSMVQTDAPINPGNSGGPLINLDGEVVGINDLIFTESGSSAGVGFAISIDLAVIIAEQLIDGVEPQLARLGVQTGVPPNGDAGALVTQVFEDTAAEAAGLEVGDIVTNVNGDPTRGSSELRAQIIDLAPGTEVTISILRDGERVELTTQLGDSSN